MCHHAEQRGRSGELCVCVCVCVQDARCCLTFQPHHMLKTSRETAMRFAAHYDKVSVKNLLSLQQINFDHLETVSFILLLFILYSLLADVLCYCSMVTVILRSSLLTLSEKYSVKWRRW